MGLQAPKKRRKTHEEDSISADIIGTFGIIINSLQAVGQYQTD